jgi:hypothetical protein
MGQPLFHTRLSRVKPIGPLLGFAVGYIVGRAPRGKRLLDFSRYFALTGCLSVLFSNSSSCLRMRQQSKRDTWLL